MSIQIPIDANVTQVEAKLKNLGIQTQAINQAAQGAQIKLLQVYTYSAHIATLISSMAQRATKGTEAQLQAQMAAQGIAALSTEVSIGTTMAQAFGMIALGQYGQAGALFAAAALMQINLGEQLSLQERTRQAQRETQAIREQMDRW